MKKLVLILCLFLSVNTVFAFDVESIKQKAVNAAVSQVNNINNGNLKQIQAEKELKQKLRSEQTLLSLHYLVIEQDKEAEESMYNVLTNAIKSKSNTTNTKYANLAKNLYDDILKTGWENVPTPAEFERKKIIISDSDFNLIDDDVKNVIYALNVY